MGSAKVVVRRRSVKGGGIEPGSRESRRCRAEQPADGSSHELPASPVLDVWSHPRETPGPVHLMSSGRRSNGVKSPTLIAEKSIAVPRSAIWLGASGFLPFGAAALAAAFLDEQFAGWATAALMTYGAVILSFLGGIHWGVAIASDPGAGALPRRLVMSVAPSLIAWAGLLLPHKAGLLLL